MIKIRNVPNLTLGRPDAGALSNVAIGIEATLTSNFELALSRINEEPQYQLLINNESSTSAGNHGGIVFTQGVGAATELASIKTVYTAVDGYVDLSFNTRSVSNALYIKADGKVGIGTGITAPGGSDGSARLDVRGRVSVIDNGAELQIIPQTDRVDIEAWDNSTDRSPKLPLSLNPYGGNVGIGTGSTAPDALLEISHSAASHDSVLRLTGAHASGYAAGIEWQSGYGPKTSAQMFSTANSTQGGEFWINVRDQATNALVDRLHIDKDGNIGIGTGSLSVIGLLDVRKNTTGTILHLGGSTDTPSHGQRGLKFISSDVVVSSTTFSGALHTIDATSSQGIIDFSTGGTARVRIAADGKVGIGTGSNSPQSHLTIASNGANDTPAELGLWATDVSILDDDTIARIVAQGTDSNTINAAPYQGAKVEFNADADWNTNIGYDNYQATRIDFFTQDNTGTDTLSSPRLTISSDGKIGIGTGTGTGTAAPPSILTVTENTAADKTILLTNSTAANGRYSSIVSQHSTTDTSFEAGIRFIKERDTAGNYGSSIGFLTELDAAGKDYDYRLYIQNGNVGIGATEIAASTKLIIRTSTDHNFEFEEVSGELRLSALNDARSANIPLELAASEFKFLTGDLVVNEKVGIGTDANGPDTALHVVGDALTVDSSGINTFTRDTTDGTGTGTVLELFHDYNGGGTVDDDRGCRLAMGGDTDGASSRTALQFDVPWTDITDATRTSDLIIKLVDNASALTEKFRFTGAGVFKVSGTSRIQANILHNIDNTANIIYRSGTTTIVGHSADALIVNDGTGGVTMANNLDVDGTIRATTLKFGSESVTVTSIDAGTDLGAASTSDTTLATQKAIKTYIDTQLTAEDLDFTTDTAGDSSVDLDNQKLIFAGGEGMDVTHSGQTITIAAEDASLTNKGVASFSSTFFSDSSGVMSLLAAQTGITSLLAGDIKIGEDDQTKIDFETANTINFYAGNENQLVLTDGYLTPSANAIVDLGTDALEFNDLWIDGTANIDSLVAGTADINGGTIDGAAINSTTIGATAASSGKFTTLEASSTLGVTGITTLAALLNANGGIAVDTDKFTVDTSGNTVIEGSVKLQGSATSNADVGEINFYNSTNHIASITGARSGYDNSGALNFSTSQLGTLANRVVIESNGEVQISGGKLRLGDGSVLPPIGEKNLYHHIPIIEDDSGRLMRAYTAVQVVVGYGGEVDTPNPMPTAATERATASAIIRSDGKILGVKVIKGGEGYSSTYADRPSVTFKGGQPGDGTPAQATAVVVGDKVTEINVTYPGSKYFGVGIVKPEEVLEIADIIDTDQSNWATDTVGEINVVGVSFPYGVGYTIAPIITIGEGWETGASYSVTTPKTQVFGSNDVLYEIVAGSTTNAQTEPTHRFGEKANDQEAHDGVTYQVVGERAQATAIVDQGFVTQISIVDCGSGYNAAPNVTVDNTNQTPPICTTCLQDSNLTAVLGGSKVCGFNMVPNSLIDESNEIIIGSSTKIPQLRVSTKGLIIGFAEKDNIGGGGAGGGAGSGLDELRVTVHDNLYFNTNRTNQTRQDLDGSNNGIDSLDIYADTSIFALDLVDTARVNIDIDGSPTGGTSGSGDSRHDARGVVHVGTNEEISHVDIVNEGEGYPDPATASNIPDVTFNAPTKRPLLYDPNESYAVGEWVFYHTLDSGDCAGCGYAYERINANGSGGENPETSAANSVPANRRWKARTELNSTDPELIEIGPGDQAHGVAVMSAHPLGTGSHGWIVSEINITDAGEGYYPDDRLALLGDSGKLLSKSGTPIAEMASALRSDDYPGVHYRAKDLISKADNNQTPGFDLSGNTLYLKVADDSDSVDLSSLKPAQVVVVNASDTDDVDHYLTFVDDANVASTSQLLYTNAGIKFNPKTDSLTIGNDLLLKSDLAVLKFGADSDVTLTHVADTALILNSSRQLQFGDSGTYINQSTNGQLDIVADTTLELTAPTTQIESNTIDLGTNTNTDTVLNFLGTTYDGKISWMEDEDYFKFSDEILLSGTAKIYFNDTSQFIHGSDAATLSIGATTEIDITAATVDINASVKVDISNALTVGGATTLAGNLLHLNNTNLSLSSTVETINGQTYSGRYLKLVTTSNTLVTGGTTPIQQYLQIGTGDAGYMHFKTDADKYYFNKDVYADGEFYKYESGGSHKKVFHEGNLSSDQIINWKTANAGTIDPTNYVDNNTMGSGFTVSATTDTTATTITQGDDLFFAAGTGITCTTSADGTVTIANTVTDTVDMGSGFTVSASTDTTPTTITESDDLFFAAGTGITCETTADGTVTIANTVTDTVDMGSGFTVSATTDTTATTITESDDLFFAAGTGITCETTADGTVTITNSAPGDSDFVSKENGGTFTGSVSVTLPPWATGTYAKNAEVTHINKSWISKEASNTQEPSATATKWDEISNQSIQLGLRTVTTQKLKTTHLPTIGTSDTVTHVMGFKGTGTEVTKITAARLGSMLSLSNYATDTALSTHATDAATALSDGLALKLAKSDSVNIGTTSVALNRASAALTLADVTVAKAGQWTNSRTVYIGAKADGSTPVGDISGSFSLDGSANVASVNLSIKADSVELGTQTSGHYVKNLTVPAANVGAGNGIVVGGAAEGGTPTVKLDKTSSPSLSKLTLTNMPASDFSIKAHSIIPNSSGNIGTGAGDLVSFVSGQTYTPTSSGETSVMAAFKMVKNSKLGSLQRYFHKLYVVDPWFLGWGGEASDGRFKNAVKPLDWGLNLIRLLKPVEYEQPWSETPRKKFGLIAQEVEEAIEEVGIEAHSLVSIHDYFEDPEGMKNLSYGQINIVLLNAVKELDAKVQELEAKLDELS